MIKAVILDFDGLLADTEVIAYKTYAKLLNEYGYDFSQKEYAESYSGRTDIKNAEQISRSYSLPLSVEECMERAFFYEKQFYKQGVSLKNGAEELLRYLKRNAYQTVVGSSAMAERAMKVMEEHEIVQYIDAFVFAEDIERSKPDPEVFLKASEKLQYDHSSCLVLEDSEAGIEAAYRAGMKVICIPDMKRPSREFLDKCEAVFDSLLQVKEYLEQNKTADRQNEKNAVL